MVQNFSQGLSTAQYNQNVQLYGLNKLPEKTPPSKLKIFLSQFTNPLVYILVIAALLTLAVQLLEETHQLDFTEFIGIMAVVLVNGVLSYLQEDKAEETLQTLTKSIRPETNVIRDGKIQRISVSQLTIGDVVELKLGDKVPADGVIVEATDVTVDEAVLTGEAEAVAKIPIQDKLELSRSSDIEDSNKLFMGTSVMSGIARIVVTEISTRTKFGEIADSIATQENVETPLQLRLRIFTRNLSIFILAISLFILLWGLASGLALVEILELAISVTVSAIPEGLIVALTVILALGMRRILKRKAVVRKLVAAETLGSVDTICIDKTGTLTLGKMQVVQTFFSDETLARKTLIATNHRINSVEIAALAWLKTHVSAKEEVLIREEPYIKKKIFDSTTKFSATQGEENTYFVGAPEIILANTTLTAEKKTHWGNQMKDFSRKGMRMVALGYKESKDNKFSTTELAQDIIWLGLIVIEDPIRPNLAKVFKQTSEAGITVKVITGDFGETARTVMSKIGIDLNGDEMVSGKELSSLSDRELSHRMDKIKLFYRTTPQQKLRIIENLQMNGHVVAMMGDGINDTPALKKAEIGIVVENATDFSKEIADMVLIDSNFKTIIAAIEEGRSIFENMRKVLAYLLSDSVDELVIVLGSLMLGMPIPLLPLQILYINFIADGLPDLALSFEKPRHEVMKDKPKPKNYPLLDGEVRVMILTIGLVVSLGILLLYAILLDQGVSEAYSRTIVMLTVGINSLVYIFPIKSFRKNIWHINLFDNKMMIYGVLIGLVSMIFAIYNPFMQNLLGTVHIAPADWIIVFGIAFIDVLIIELIKSVYIERSSKTNT